MSSFLLFTIFFSFLFFPLFLPSFSKYPFFHRSIPLINKFSQIHLSIRIREVKTNRFPRDSWFYNKYRPRSSSRQLPLCRYISFLIKSIRLYCEIWVEEYIFFFFVLSFFVLVWMKKIFLLEKFFKIDIIKNRRMRVLHDFPCNIQIICSCFDFISKIIKI